jgi:hypothetical protein
MARIPYADLNNPEAKPLVDRITAERGSVSASLSNADA